MHELLIDRLGAKHYIVNTGQYSYPSLLHYLDCRLVLDQVEEVDRDPVNKLNSCLVRESLLELVMADSYGWRRK
jgi:hypothetical protein